MRVLYCNKYNFAFSGTESYLFSVMEMMRERGHEAALFSVRDARGEATPYDHHFVAPVDFKDGSWMHRAGLAFRAAYSVEARRKLRAMIGEFRPEVAHVRNVYHHLTPSIFWELRAQGIPVLYHMNDFKMLCPSYNMVSSHGEPCERCKEGKFWNVVREGCYARGRAASAVLAAEAYLHRWLQTYEKCVDLILAPSQFVKEKLIEGGWDDRRVEVLPHFQNVPTDTEPHPGSKGTILYFGRLSAEKGVQDVISAAAKLPELKFVIAGDGPLRNQLATQGRSLDNVRFVGYVTGARLEQLIAESQFTVFPSHAYETLGKSILESYAQARAVIASDLGSRRELVREGETGLLYCTGDINQLVNTIRFLSNEPAWSRNMGEEARKLVIQRHSPDEHFRALTGVYERLAPGIEPKRAGIAASVKVAFIGGRGVVGKYSGVETFYEQVGKRLTAKGHKITAYCRSYFTPDQPSYAGICIVRLPTIRSKHLETFVHTLLSTLHACFSDFEIVHYHTLGPSLFSFIPRLFGKKTVVTVQGLDWQRRKWSWFARSLLKAGEWASAHFPDQTIVVSRTLEDYYRQRYRKPVAYIPNGTVIRSQRAGTALQRFGLSAGNYVLFMGRLSPEKNCDLLIEAFEQIKTPMKLVFAGGSSHTDAYVSALRSHESDGIRFLGWLAGNDLEEVLTNAALFVLPSDMEGLSLALLDAMGAGLCVLASDVPENREVIANAGFTFSRGDLLHLCQMLTMLLSEGHIRESAGRRARERVLENYLWERVTSGLERVYAEALSAKSQIKSASAKAHKRAA